MRTATHRARESQRDLRFANTENPAPRGEVHSSVSEVSLTRLAHQRLAAAGPEAAASPVLDPSLRAGITPRGGQTRPAGDAGVRPQTGSATQNPRGKGPTGPAR
jgi:hypothetical protein